MWLFFYFFITVKTLHCWPCGIVSLLTLSNQPLNSSNNDQISLALTLTGLNKGNLRLITSTRNPQKEPYSYSAMENNPARLPAFDISVQQPHKLHQWFWFPFSKKRIKWLACAWMWGKTAWSSLCYVPVITRFFISTFSTHIYETSCALLYFSNDNHYDNHSN